MARPQPKKEVPVIANTTEKILLTNRELKTIIAGINKLSNDGIKLHSDSTYGLALMAYQVDEAFKPAANLITKINESVRPKIDEIRGNRNEDELQKDQEAMAELIELHNNVEKQSAEILDGPILECSITKFKRSDFIDRKGDKIDVGLDVMLMLFKVLDNS